MLEDQLLLRSGLQDHRIFIETLDSTRKLDAAHEVDRDVAAFLPGTVEKAVLYRVLLLYWFFHPSTLPWKFSLVVETNIKKLARARVVLPAIWSRWPTCILIQFRRDSLNEKVRGTLVLCLELAT